MIVKIAHRGPATISLCVRFPELVTKQVDVIDLWHNFFMLLVPRDIYRRKSRVRRDSCEFPARHQFICNNRCQRLHDYINHTCHDKNQSIPHTSRHLLLPSDMNYKEFHDVPSTTPKNGWESRQGGGEGRRPRLTCDDDGYPDVDHQGSLYPVSREINRACALQM